MMYRKNVDHRIKKTLILYCINLVFEKNVNQAFEKC